MQIIIGSSVRCSQKGRCRHFVFSVVAAGGLDNDPLASEHFGRGHAIHPAGGQSDHQGAARRDKVWPLHS